MKRPAITLLSVLMLAACGSSEASTTYDLGIKITDMKLRESLAAQSMRVIERRMDRMGETIKDSEIDVSQSGATITIVSEHAEAQQDLTEQLQGPFSFDIMAQTQPGETADITIEQHGDFTRTGITGADVDWVQARQTPGAETGEVRMIFTEAGRAKLAALFQKMQGKNIGVFVRDQLVSKLQVQTDKIEEDIVISGIPSADLANIFADDVNVGLHVTFTPVP
jgi:preprotein translocase subunit SecD